MRCIFKPRWSVLILAVVARSALAAPAGAPCGAGSESRQFDFWIGDWNVEETSAPGQTIASSREERISGGYALLENYEQGDGYSGKSLNFFDPVLKKWRQTWADSAGNASEFSGEFRDGAMRFEGESHVGSGKRIFRKLTFTPLPGGSVRQYSEASLDGKTWRMNYDYTYRPKKRDGAGSPSSGSPTPNQP